MKCTHCGFTYDDERICPICGTPAPAEEVRTESAVPPFAAPPLTAAPAPAARPVRPSAPAAPRHAERSSGSKGLRIATLCVLAVIAFSLILVALLQSISLFRSQRQKELFRQLAAPPTQPSQTDPLSTEPDSPVTDMKYITDKNIRRVGESFDFGRGVVALKSVTVTREKSTFSSKTQQVGFLLQIYNNTNQAQEYDAPCMTLGNSSYDAAHYAFAEFSLDQSSGSCTVQPGKSYYAMYYYNLPKENPETTAQVYVFGNSGSYTAATVYSLDLGSVQQEETEQSESTE